MANKKYDGVIEAVHYAPDGQVDWVRVYLRRGNIWSDRVILHRSDLINEIKSGKRMVIGKPVEFMGNTFDVTLPLQMIKPGGQEILSTSSEKSDRDCLEGAPIL